VRKSSKGGGTRGVSTLPGAPVRKRGRLVRSRRAEQACPRARRAAAQRESEGRPPRQGTRIRRVISARHGPLAPSLVGGLAGSRRAEQACLRARRAAAQRESEGRATPPRDAHPGEHSSSTTWPLGAEPRRPSCQSRNSGRAPRAAGRGRAATGFARLASARSFTYTYGLWPMMRPEAVTGATRALRCRDWHEVRVDARTDR